MKILTLHSDYISFEPKQKAIKSAEEVNKAKQTVKDCLVVFTSVEKADEENPDAIVERLFEEVKNVADQVKAKKIVLYPFAHLSSNLASPDKAFEILKKSESRLKKEFEVTRAPFGWYKEFEIKCKGHPLAELSREFTALKTEKTTAKETGVSAALKAEEKLVSNWYVLDGKGTLHKIEKKDGKVVGFDFSKYPKLEKLANYEIAKNRAVKEEPPHVKFMKSLELVDYEPASDPGNMRFYPKGRMIKALLETFVTKKMQEYGALEVETPIMYDYEHPALKSYLNRFPARQYTVETPNKKAFLRFSACFGQFLMAKDAQLSYRALPLKLYELTRYSFRAEQHGELTGLRRLRAFTMPDCHAICADMGQAKEEMKKRFELAKDVLGSIGISTDDLELAVRVTKDFYDNNKEHVDHLVKSWGKPVLVEMWSEKFFYFVLKYEMNFVDALDKASALATDQIDVENAQRYGIVFDDKDGKKKTPLILHLSPSGAIERDIYALLEKAWFDQKAGNVAMLPLWLSPTQVRIIPVSDERHAKFAEKLSDELEKENIRVDIDDTPDTVGRRIVDSEKDWVPYVLVVGDNEMNGKELQVRIRENGKQEKWTKEKLVKTIKSQVDEMPFRPIPEPRELSKRPKFVS